MKVFEIIAHLEEIAPPQLAGADDRIGLQVGDGFAEVKRIAVGVDPIMRVIERATEMGAELLVTHHPLIYRPLEAVVAGVPVADSVTRLIKGGTALYVMHTNYDSVQGGTNDVLAEMLGIRITGILSVWQSERKFKVAVFVPSEAVGVVGDAMAGAGAGTIGNYAHCSFRSPGVGTFLPQSGAQPHIGKVGRLEEAEEYRLEMIVPEWRLGAVVSALVAAHPYEEAAYDIYPLANEVTGYGPGRVGAVDTPMKLSELKKRVGDILDFPTVRHTGDTNRLITTAALCSGGGRSLLHDAIKSGVDVYITADMSYHDMLEADDAGLAVIDVGHYHSERPGMEALAERLAKDFAPRGLTVQFVP